MMKFVRYPLLAGFLLIFFSLSQAQMRITEWMYGGGNGEFIEFTNVGNTAIDMTGWSFDDNSQTPGSFSLSIFGIVAPGESVILTENADATVFRTAWGLCNNNKVIPGLSQNLSRNDEINLYNGTTLVDRLTFGDENFPGTIRTNNRSGYVSAAGLATNTITEWTLSAVADGEGSITSTGGDIGSPGKSTRATVAYNPCFVSPTAPTIQINVTNTSNFLDGGVSVSPVSPFAVSAVMSDAGDPASTDGIDFTIGDDATAAGSLTVTVQSSNQTVVPDANLQLAGSGADRNLKIAADAVGYSIITINVSDGVENTSYYIAYAASEDLSTGTNYWHTGISDASAAIAVDDNYMIIANDESNLFYIYDRANPGLPVATYDFNQGNVLALTDGTAGNWKEVDVEAGVKSITTPGKIYWLGSMSNNSDAEYKPNRDRLFAVTASGTGSAISFANAGSYSNLRQQLINWGDANGYNFSASAANLKDAKTIDGFNIEGMVFGPDNTTMYIGFRAPLVPTASRTKAVIAPILNFETWFNNGAPVGNPGYGAPIELDLAGRGIRDIIRLSNNNYIIIAGSYGDAANGAVYLWTGVASEAPTPISTLDISTLNVEGVMQINTSGALMADRLQVISDMGDNIVYNDGTVSKDLSWNNHKKFSSDIVISSAGNVLPITFEYFTAAKQDKSVVLNWKNSASEIVKQFEVLRSGNGKDFTVIGTVTASADQTTYSFADNVMDASSRLYYRIRAIEHSGLTTLTNIRFVDFSNQTPLITLYPNPVVNNQFSVMVNKAGTGTKTVTVFGSNGMLFRKLTFNGQVTDISTAGWPGGWYLVNIKSNDGTDVTYKLIVP